MFPYCLITPPHIAKVAGELVDIRLELCSLFLDRYVGLVIRVCIAGEAEVTVTASAGERHTVIPSHSQDPIHFY